MSARVYHGGKKYIQWRSSQSHFSDTDTLSLATRHTTNEVGSDLGVVSVAETEHRHDYFSDMGRKLLSRQATNAMTRCASGGSKLERLTNCQMRLRRVN
jgi:hypothetical protein